VTADQTSLNGPADAGALVAQAAIPADRDRYVRRRFWGKVRRTLGHVPFLEDAIAAFYCATDRATPATVKAILFGALAYFILPFDAIPDFVAGLGYTDDVAVLLAAIRAVAQHITPEHRARARETLDRLSSPSPPSSAAAAGPVG
jgi:uncharacterized membrane protein YkvA (DUF1232 family)